MTLVSTGDILDRERAVLAFNVIQLEHAEAIVSGAEAAGRPVVLQISENAAKYHGALAPITRGSLEIAAAASVDVGVHLDHAEDEALVREAVSLGATSVMFDAATLPYSENVERTAAVARHAQERGVWVEAELGAIGGKGGAHTPGVRTDPAEAVAFVAATGVDGLAVAVGSSHAMTSRSASLDFGLIAELAAAVPVPLVLHGSSGVSDDDIVTAIENGMRKINISTHINGVFTRAVREALDADPALVDPRKYFAPARAAVATEVTRLLRTLTP
ncbi:class II fructose-bisphosphate aldolase [Herbiconiux sp. KACC 21604]|uniref:class II fructose-bisphosphate aldolase n=1 Tax=unclassified Herbiconiux TaxID=2618217 RepID=UPI0014931B7A|nr:class II fructose-bisphosphate aldolase [Herbiconiux sp. SALV-R1]QJU53116.1 class II fructose-bisphosphate aldolase [Herbiconiux sp. SALV-R1]WPO88057.1 class II fructose-bisphosphate aldolase [Herbiconiux sp. KACC 21604]